MKVDDIVLYKGKKYKIFFDYNNGLYELLLPGGRECLLVKHEEITKCTIIKEEDYLFSK